MAKKEKVTGAIVEAEDEGALREAEADANNQNEPLSEQINKLGNFILDLDCGHPRDESAVEAAISYITELRADLSKAKEDHGEACKLVAQMHAAAVGEVTGPTRGVVEDVEDALNALRARVGELEDLRQTGAAAGEKDPVESAYELFCQGQSEGDYPAWAELPAATQKLWRDGYQHVADGGKPRTDYEHAVKYLIVSAQ